ncbi:hypothetical protein Leryth_025878 [Lithospermum erythrorhizon]|nr:hypothetical protein Leryth_025878 [Lithospermum erythrorhizon]
MSNESISLLCLSSFVQCHNGIKSNPLQSLLSPNCSLRNSDNIVSEYQDTDEYKPVYIGPQDGLKEVDKIVSLPGQPIDLVALATPGAFMSLNIPESILMGKLFGKTNMHGTMISKDIPRMLKREQDKCQATLDLCLLVCVDLKSTPKLCEDSKL